MAVSSHGCLCRGVTNSVDGRRKTASAVFLRLVAAKRSEMEDFMTDYEGLIRQAMKARENAYAPYSNFYVGAALLTNFEKDGKPLIYTGCNIENSAFSPTNCAERTAFFKAVSEGCRAFKAIAIVGGGQGAPASYTMPCGVCRQVMMEFCNPETFEIVAAISESDYQVYKLKELLPEAFGAL